MTEARNHRLEQAMHDAGLSHKALARAVRELAHRDGRPLGTDHTAVSRWLSGMRPRSAAAHYVAEVLTRRLGRPVELADLGWDGREAGLPATDELDELTARLSHVRASLDSGLVALLEGQTQTLRTLDRRLGAGRLLAQTESHLEQMSDLLAYAAEGPQRRALASAAAEAAALAGWQALDLGRPDRAWSLHETAKSAARDSEDASVLAHVTAQQAYALLDIGRTAEARDQIQRTRRAAAGRVPAVMSAWLSAADAEAASADGAPSDAHDALDDADAALEAGDGTVLPFLFLDANHLARWRGSCLAQLGNEEALESLQSALELHDPTFTRAHAGLHCDLATAYLVRGEMDGVRRHTAEASTLADATTSVRQRRRLERLLKRSA